MYIYIFIIYTYCRGFPVSNGDCPLQWGSGSQSEILKPSDFDLFGGSILLFGYADMYIYIYIYIYILPPCIMLHDNFAHITCIYPWISHRECWESEISRNDCQGTNSWGPRAQVGNCSPDLSRRSEARQGRSHGGATSETWEKRRHFGTWWDDGPRWDPCQTQIIG